MSKSYLQRRKDAFRYAFRGIGMLFSNEAHAKIHLTAAILVIAAGIILEISLHEWCLISLCIGGVFTAEAFNTAIERLADAITKERNPLIGAAKDIAAGAVLLFVFAAIATGLIIFLPKIFPI